MKESLTSIVRRAAVAVMTPAFIACGADYGVGPTSVENNLITLTPKAVAYRRDGALSLGAQILIYENSASSGGGPGCSVPVDADSGGLHHCPASGPYITLAMKTDYVIVLLEPGRAADSDSPDFFLIGTQRVTRQGSHCSGVSVFQRCQTGGLFRIVDDRGKIE